MAAMPSTTRFKPLSISHYALGFFLVMASTLAILAGVIMYDVGRLKGQIAESDRKLGQQELAQAVSLLITHADNAAQALAQWDEARLQLENSTYYGYWRNSRALAAGILPDSIDAVDLYDAKGSNLSKITPDEAYMPPRISSQEMQPALVHEQTHDHMYFFLPIYRDPKRSHLLGYAGIKFDFLVELQSLRKFRYVDLASVRVDTKVGTRILADDIVSHLIFQTVPNPEVREVEKIMARSLYEIAMLVALVSVVGYLALISIVAKPLRKISVHIEAMKQGHGGMLDDKYRGALAVAELENVRQSLNDYQQELDDMHVSLAHKNEELWVLAHHDPLTGVYNRRAFDDDWRATRRAQGKSELQVAFLLFDCDHFKAINDTYGHQTGDRVIQGLAESLHQALRSGDRLYRLGGDEFATVLLATDIYQARQMAERCIAEVTRHDFAAYGVREPVRISIGMAHGDATGDDTLEVLHRQADVAMYQAKRPGQGKIAVYDRHMGMDTETLVSNTETHAVYQAITDPSQLEMHYQPVIALPTRTTEYYEALVRIRSGDNLIPPSSIFPLVELRGLEAEFDLAVLEKVLRDLTEGKVPTGTGVALNVSGPGIINANITEKLLAFKPFMRSHKLVLEVTETSLITQIGQASANLSQLRKAGFIIALDDFGSGYSSLRYLASMPVDLVKFDITMVRILEDKGRQALFVEDLARTIQDAGYQLVAEGIESEALLNRVAQLGFSHAQGFHIGRPAPLPASDPGTTSNTI